MDQYSGAVAGAGGVCDRCTGEGQGDGGVFGADCRDLNGKARLKESSRALAFTRAKGKPDPVRALPGLPR